MDVSLKIIPMDFSLFLTIIAAAIGFFVIFRKFRYHQENQETDPPSDVSSLAVSTVKPPASSSHNWIHDVFPSFRGEDVRIDFLSHIQKEFGRKGITRFIDNEIKRGESIAPELIRAIRGSKIAIILLSKNYASSKWCLDELVEIMNCRENLGQIVMVIFYKVDPSHVKKLAGDFGKVFKKTCAGESKEYIERWRQALVKVATIAGYDSSNWDNEAAIIEKIAMDVSNQLINYAPSSDFGSLVGMRAHMEKMNSFLHLDSNKVKMIGIWGPSGIGKSTIARFLYNQYAHQFQLSVFMENIKRRYPNIPGYDEYGAKLQLQKQFLSQILNQEDIKIHHLGVVEDRLKHKRVFVVLDDVDHMVQLNAMAKELRWFGPGSRIIITTQDKRLLNAHGIKLVYKVDFPCDDEALEIFCTYAFGQKCPYEGFEVLSREVTELAGKLPLGLRVLGSYFKGMLKQEWKKALPRLRISLDGEIKSTLKFSYDALHAEYKDLFLYIAFFFKNKHFENVEACLANNFSNVSRGLHILVEKSLISITCYGYIEMHDLLERLGREIVSEQSFHDPRQRKVLVNATDVCQELINDTLSYGSIIGTIIDFYKIEIEEVKYTVERALERMFNLQFLRINGDGFRKSPRFLKNLSQKVRLLDWQYCKRTCLPSNFNPEFLVELDMRYSELETLWKGNKTIKNLKWVDLSYSRNLRKLPDLSTGTNLCKLDLKGCLNLMMLPSSIGNAINLKKLDLSYCTNLVMLPSSIGKATSLRQLDLSHCSKLVELPSSIGDAINLEELYLSSCSSLVELPSSIGGATNLRILLLNDCSNLRELPTSISNATYLKLSGCSNLVKLPSYIENSINFQQLRLVGFFGEVNLRGCSSLVDLPSYIWNANLNILSLHGCSSLLEIPSSIGNAINLKKLYLSGCTNLVELPSSIGNLINLMELDRSGCSSLVELPSSIGNLRDLSRLRLQGCSKLEVLPANIKMVPLYELDFTNCSLLKTLPEISTHTGVLKLSETAIEEVPSSLRSWSRLDELYISHIKVLHLSDTRIQEIPPWIKELSLLRELVIKGCTKLVSLPELPDSLEIFDAENCESLERLDCSFPNTTFVDLNFANCFKLNQEARDLIIKASSCGLALFPGETVPAHFTYRADRGYSSVLSYGLGMPATRHTMHTHFTYQVNGGHLSMKSNGLGMPATRRVRFKACVSLVYKADVEDGDGKSTVGYGLKVYSYIKEKENGFEVGGGIEYISLRSPLLKKHMLIFDCDGAVSSSELVFEVEVYDDRWEVEECGICITTD